MYNKSKFDVFVKIVLIFGLIYVAWAMFFDPRPSAIDREYEYQQNKVKPYTDMAKQREAEKQHQADLKIWLDSQK